MTDKAVTHILSKLSKLQTLILSGCPKVTIQSVKNIVTCPYLQSIALRGTHVTQQQIRDLNLGNQIIVRLSKHSKAVEEEE